jgi:thioredoxin reductase (NADPH)
VSAPLDLLVIGAGPAGLATAIAAQQAGLGYEVVEKGVLVNSIFHFPRHMTFFTTAELLEIGRLPFVTPFEKPTQAEGLKYYRKVTETYGLRVTLGEEVVAVRPVATAVDGARFDVLTRGGGGGHRRARNVVVATGYYDNPVRLGLPGEDRPNVSHYYTEPHPYFRKAVVVVGGKNSAAIAALELYRTGAQVTLVYRRARLSDSIKYWIRPDIENRIKEGAIAARFETCVTEIRERSVVLASGAGLDEVEADQVFLLTGYLPDTRMLREAGVRVDERTLVPEHDPATLETNVRGLYVAGALVSGRQTSRIFIENGRFHGDQIIAGICPEQGGAAPHPPGPPPPRRE